MNTYINFSSANFYFNFSITNFLAPAVVVLGIIISNPAPLAQRGLLNHSQHRIIRLPSRLEDRHVMMQILLTRVGFFPGDHELGDDGAREDSGPVEDAGDGLDGAAAFLVEHQAEVLQAVGFYAISFLHDH